MSSSYNNVSSSPRQSFLLSAIATAAPRANSVVAPPKKRRAGNPHPDAEVIALSPRTIMATNMFVCELCSRRFLREQNLHLHMKVHKFPGELKQKSNEEVRKKVYVCPDPTCLHHDPSRALGDITGMKKHFFRKHCEKNWHCKKCTKRYALQSDLKVHSKICGTKVYECDCGTVFSRRDKYTTHKFFCDASIDESARNPAGSVTAVATTTSAGSSGGLTFCDIATFARSENQGNNPNSSFTLNANYNLNGLSSTEYEDFAIQNSSLDLSPINQHSMITLGDNKNVFSLGYFKGNTKSSHPTSTHYPFTEEVVNNNDSSALLRGLNFSSSSSVINNNYGKNIGYFQGLMNSLPATTNNHGQYDIQFGDNLNIGGSDMMTLDFFGVNGRVSRNGASNLNDEMNFTTPNNPFGNA